MGYLEVVLGGCRGVWRSSGGLLGFDLGGEVLGI